MQKSKLLALSNSLENLLFPPGKYTSAQLLNLTPYFTVGQKFTLEKYSELMRQIFDVEDDKLWWVVVSEYGEVDAKVMLIVLMLQLIGREKRDIGGYNEGVKNQISKDATNSNLTSPRSKTTRALYISNEQTFIMNYIKENLTYFLKLLTNEPNIDDPYIEPEQLQPLNVLFKVDRNKKFSSYLPIFSKSTKLKASTISEHLINRITISQQELIGLEGLSYSVTIKEELHCQDKDLRIIGCEDSEIFIDSAVRSLYVVNCLNCTIYVAACERLAFIDKCEKICFTTAVSLLRICNTVDSLIYYYGPSPIIMTGDNRSVGIGPNNSASELLPQHLKSAGIDNNDKHYNNFQWIMSKNQMDANSWYKMSLADFDLLVMPDKNEDNQQKTKNDKHKIPNILAPKQYIRQLQDRNKYYKQVKSKLAKISNNSENVKCLHSALQGEFKEWLIAKGYTKNLKDLVKCLDRNDR